MVDEVFTGFEITAMWNLNGNDIKTAKQQLESRRAKLKADYEAELQKIDVEIADIETVERVAVNFVSSHKNGDAATIETEPQRAAEKDPWSSDPAPDLKSSTDPEKPADTSAESHDKPAGSPVEQKGSRWRMRLGTVSETEAA